MLSLSPSVPLVILCAVILILSYFQLFWTPDVIIHDLVSFNKPEILNQVGALEIYRDGRVYYKVR